MEKKEKRIRVLVVDDSAFARLVISNILRTDPDIEVVGTARNGEEALTLIKKLKPDVVTLDVEMPVMDGLTALEIIMKTMPLPVIMVSSLTVEGAEVTLKALDLGAVDFVTKPKRGKLSQIAEELIGKIKMAVGARIKKLPWEERPRVIKVVHREMAPTVGRWAVAIGTSTGGPKALQEVVPALPPKFPAALLIVQHMPPIFTRLLAQRLDKASNIPVKEAEDGEEVREGVGYVAPGGKHMTLVLEGKKPVVRLTDDPPVHGVRPAVDKMMLTAADVYGSNIIGVVLTGMGSDGTEGLKKIKSLGGKTIAEDKSTCVVFGMPRRAIEEGVVDYVLPLDKIPGKIVEILSEGS